MKYLVPFLIITTITSLFTIAGIFFVDYEYNSAQKTLNEISLKYKNHLLIKNLELREQVGDLSIQVNDLSDALDDEQDKFDDLYDTVRDSLKTVGILQKLQETDEELLQKYSKVYFLNEHYNPKQLVDIPKKYLIGEKQLQIKSEVWPFLKKLLEDADDDDIEFRILSAYRSFGTQESIKQNYVTTYGTTAANTFSADQGYSEHQLGTTIDFTTKKTGTDLSEFKNTEGYEWLERRAYRYGFTLSYPEGNTHYVSEPWHWRFVGEDLARDLYRKDNYFYDLDQRKLNEYLIDIFED